MFAELRELLRSGAIRSIIIKCCNLLPLTCFSAPCKTDRPQPGDQIDGTRYRMDSKLDWIVPSNASVTVRIS